MDDLGTLMACSLTCKFFFHATRPLIHQRLVCLGSRRVLPKSKPKKRRKRDPGAFERLIHADRLGVLPYTRHLTLKPDNVSSYPFFYPSHLQEYLPQFRSIIKLQTLTLTKFNIPSFIPVFNEYFGMFTNSLRHLDIRTPYGTAQEFSYIICQFPLLEDLTIISPADGLGAHPVPAITQSPPLRGKLVLVQAATRELSEGLATLPGGLNFRSLELSWCTHLQPIIAACAHSVTSISYCWRSGDTNSESDPSIRVSRCNLGDYSGPTGPQAKRGTGKI